MIQNSCMENPFQFGRELGANELVDRLEELADVIGTIRQGGKLFLVGPRRFGKTSILKAADDRLTENKAVVLRYDAEGYPSLSLLASAIISGAATNLKGSVERVGEQIKQFFSRLRPELSFNVTDREWNVRLGVQEVEDIGSHLKHLQLLLEALNGLEKLAKAQPASRPVGLIIDEFQKVIELGGKTAESQIRAAVQQHKRTGYVFAGSKTHLLTAMTMDASRPFYRLGKVLFLTPIPREDFLVFLRQRFIESGFHIVQKENDESLRLILDLAEDVPYNVQMLAHACWDSLRSGNTVKERTLYPAVVVQSLDRIVRQTDPFYTQLWNGLTVIQQTVLIAVVAESGMNLQSMKVVNMVGKSHATIRRALDAFIERSILREEEHLGSVRVRFEDPFFAQWTLRFTART